MCDSETYSASNKLNSHCVQQQQNFQSDVNNDIAIIEQSDCESECSLLTMNPRSTNGQEVNLSWDKKLVIELCDFAACSKSNCDVPDHKEYKIKEQIQEYKKRKVDQHGFHTRKKHVIYKEEISDEEEVSNEETDDSDWEEKNLPEIRKERERKEKMEEKEKKKKLKEEEKQRKKEEKEKEKMSRDREKQIENLSSFELERQKHLDDKMAFLKSLMINEIVDDLEETAKSQTKKKPRVLKPKEILEASRKSKRMENLKINLSEQALEAKVYEEANSSNEKLELPSVYSFEDAVYGEENNTLNDFDKYFGNMEMKEEISSTNFSHDLGRCGPQMFTSYLFPSALKSIAFHPAVDRTILLAGSVHGQIFLWNTNTEPYCFAPHTENVTLLKVNPECPTQIFSSSTDGTMRQTDIENKAFTEVFKTDVQLKYFDFISPSEFLVAQNNGYISLVDCREKRFRSGFKKGSRSAALWRCSTKNIRTISAHPTKKDLCLSLDADGLMKVWDRRFQKECVSHLLTDYSVLSAFLSPLAGNSILCSTKFSLRIYDSSHLEKNLTFQCQFEIHPVSHNIIEGVWKRPSKKLKMKTSSYTSQSNYLTTANWLPRSDNTFIVCNNTQKKTIIMESNERREISSLNNSEGIMLFQEVHPVQNILAIASNVTQMKTSKIYLYRSETCT